MHRALLALFALTLTWTDNTGGVASTRIERRANGPMMFSSYAVVATTPPSIAGWSDPVPHGGERYCYRVLAYADFGESPYSDEACGTALTPPPAAPKGGRAR